jgi:aminomethyltransferase
MARAEIHAAGRASIDIPRPRLTPARGCVMAAGSEGRAGETLNPVQGAEGATAPESLRQKDRARLDTLESARRRQGLAGHRRGNPPDSRIASGTTAAKALRSSDRGGECGEEGAIVRRNRHDARRLAMSDAEQRLPLDGWHRALGARMVPFAGYSMPVQYEGIIAEHRWTRQSAGLFDVSHMGQLIVAGPGAEKALEALLPADLAILKEAKPKYSLLLNAEGGIVDDLMVTRRGEHFYLVVNGATKHGDIAYMEAELPRGVVLDHMKEQALLALQGPKAADALARLAPEVAALTFMTAGAFPLAGIRSWISRSGYTGEDGFEISVPNDRAAELAERLLREPEVMPIGLGARDSLRLEAGLCLYGHDIDTSTTPIEAALAWSIAKRRREEGGFPGAEVVQKQLKDGVSRRRVGIRPAGRAPAREGTEITDTQGNPIGCVTSGGFGPTVDGPVAMGYVAAAHAKVGTPVGLTIRGNRHDASVAAMPFVPQRYYRGR